MVRFTGNLTVDQIESRLGIVFSVEDRNFLITSHAPNANFMRPGMWHCFSYPFLFMVTDRDCLRKFSSIFGRYQDSMKSRIRLICKDAV